MYRVLGNISCELDTKVKGQIMYFLVNASPPKLLEVETSNVVPEYATLCRLVLGNILCNHDPRVKIKSEKVGILRWCTIDCSLVIIYFCSFMSYPAVPKTIITKNSSFCLKIKNAYHLVWRPISLLINLHCGSSHNKAHHSVCK